VQEWTLWTNKNEGSIESKIERIKNKKLERMNEKCTVPQGQDSLNLNGAAKCWNWNCSQRCHRFIYLTIFSRENKYLGTYLLNFYQQSVLNHLVEREIYALL
jgi:hypothetical protein